MKKDLARTIVFTICLASVYNRLSSVNAIEPTFDEMPEALSFDVSSLLHMPDEQSLNDDEYH